MTFGRTHQGGATLPPVTGPFKKTLSTGNSKPVRALACGLALS